MSPTADAKKKYIAAEKAFMAMTGLKMGSKVRVIAKVKSYQHGWNADWDSEMDEYVNDGEVYEIDEHSDAGHGFGLTCGWMFPFFALEVVPDNTVELSKQYTATINDDGSVEVGCQHVEYATLKKIYDMATTKYATYAKPPVKRKKS